MDTEPVKNDEELRKNEEKLTIKDIQDSAQTKEDNDTKTETTEEQTFRENNKENEIENNENGNNSNIIDKEKESSNINSNPSEIEQSEDKNKEVEKNKEDNKENQEKDENKEENLSKKKSTIIVKTEISEETKEKLKKIKETNYKDYLIEGRFVDFLVVENNWQVGLLAKIHEGRAYVIDVYDTSFNEYNCFNLDITDSSRISYIRSHTSPSSHKFKNSGSYSNTEQESQLHTLLLTIREILSRNLLFSESDINDTINDPNKNNTSSSFSSLTASDLFFFLRGKIFFSTEAAMAAKGAAAEPSLRLLLTLLELIAKYFGYLAKHRSELAEYWRVFREGEMKDIVLVNHKFAIFSFLEDAINMLDKILGNNGDYYNYFQNNEETLRILLPSSKYFERSALNEDFPIYKEDAEKFKDKENIKIMEKRCLSRVYKNNELTFTTNERRSKGFIIVYLIDYFGYMNGFKNLFDIILNDNDNIELEEIPLNLLSLLYDPISSIKIFTNGYSIHPEFSTKKLESFCNQYFSTFRRSQLSSVTREKITSLITSFASFIYKDEKELIRFQEKSLISIIISKLRWSTKLEEKISAANETAAACRGVAEKEKLEKEGYFYWEMEKKRGGFFADQSQMVIALEAKEICKECRDVVVDMLKDETLHDELLKRIGTILAFLLEKNFGFKEIKDTTNIDKKKNDNPLYYKNLVFDNLISRFLSSFLSNDERRIKIIRTIILDIALSLRDEDKYKIFAKIKENLFEEKNKDDNKEINKDLFEFMISFTVNSLSGNKEIKGNYFENIETNNNIETINEEDIINYSLDEKKYFGVQTMIEYIKDETYINPKSKISSTNKTLLGLAIKGIQQILSIENNQKIDISFKKHLFFMLLYNIGKGLYCVQSILIMKSLINNKNKSIKREYCEFLSYFNEKRRVFNMIEEETGRYIVKVKSPSSEDNIKSTQNSLYSQETTLKEYMEFLFLLIERDRIDQIFNITSEEFNKIFFIISLADPFSKKILSETAVSNLNKVGKKLISNALEQFLNGEKEEKTKTNNNNEIKDNNLKIKDSGLYFLFKKLMIIVNEEKGTFRKLNGEDFCVKLGENGEIKGLNIIWNTLFEEVEKETVDDAIDFLKEICLNIRPDSIMLQEAFFRSFVEKIFLRLKYLINSSREDENIKSKKITSLISLLYKIYKGTGNPGKVVRNIKVISHELETYELMTSKNELQRVGVGVNYIKNKNINNNNNDDDNYEKASFRIFETQPFYIFRYQASYEFNIPVNNVTLEINSIVGKKEKKIDFDMEKDFNENLYKDIMELYKENKNKKVEDKKFLVNVLNLENPILRQKINPKTVIEGHKELGKILLELLKEKDKEYTNELWELIKDNVEKDTIIRSSLSSLINGEIKKSDYSNLDNKSIFYINYMLDHLLSILRENMKDNNFWIKFIKSDLYTNLKKYNIEDNNKDKTNVVQILENNNFRFKIIELLALVLKIIGNNNKEEIKFVLLKTIQIIYSIMEETVNLNIKLPTNDNKKLEIYSNIVCLSESILQNDIVFELLLEELIKDNGDEKNNKDNNINNLSIKYMFNYIFTEGYLLTRLPNLPVKLKDMLTNILEQKLFKNIQSNISKKYINDINNYLLNLFLIGNFFTALQEKIKTLIVSKDLTTVINVLNYESNLKNYFSILSSILRLIIINFPAMINILFNNMKYTDIINKIYNPYIEGIPKDNKFNDIFLGGYALILFTIIKVNIDLYNGKKIQNLNIINNEQGRNMIKFLFDEIIFNKCKSDADISYYNNTKDNLLINTSFTYKNCGSLLICLLILEYLTNINNANDGCKEDIDLYMGKLKKYHSRGYWKGVGVMDWNIRSTENASNNGFVGLRNFGCTCYMNSLLQVFFNLNKFRECILSCESGNEENTSDTNNDNKINSIESNKSDNNNKNSDITTSTSISNPSANILYELKKVFYSLKFLKYGSYAPRSFVDNYEGGKINTGVQMDVDEFFGNLVDKLENRLKGSNNENIVKYFFQGRQTDNLKFKECQHHRENPINFYSIQLQISGKKNLEESLNSLTEGELMTGDNSIFCPKCNKKIPAVKSQSFKNLPRTLIFVLKRFDFNYDSMKKIKINDYFEFPVELDMTKYTNEYLDSKDNTTKNEKNDNNTETNSNAINNNNDIKDNENNTTNTDNNNEIKENDDIKKSNNLYKLKSVVIHMGNCEGGHYYALIKDSNSAKWYVFNDTIVKSFNINNLKDEAFGGREKVLIDGKEKESFKNKSAYLLFYEKVDTSNCENYEKIESIEKIGTKGDNNNNSITIGKESGIEKILQNLTLEMLKHFLTKHLFSFEYHLFCVEFFLNIALLYSPQIPKPNIKTKEKLISDFDIICKQRKFDDSNEENIDENNISKKNSNKNNNKKEEEGCIKKMIRYKDIDIYTLDTPLTLINIPNNEIKDKNIHIFSDLLIYFFNVLLRSQDKKYIPETEEIIRYMINQYDYCADYILEEFSNRNVLVEYLINCPNKNVKKIIVGLLYTAMSKSFEINLPKQKLSKKSIYQDKEKNSNDQLKDPYISPNILRLIYNSINLIEERSWEANYLSFVIAIVYRFSQVNEIMKLFLIKKIYLFKYLNYTLRGCDQEEELLKQQIKSDIIRGYKETSHKILDQKPDGKLDIIINNNNCNFTSEDINYIRQLNLSLESYKKSLK